MVTACTVASGTTLVGPVGDADGGADSEQAAAVAATMVTIPCSSRFLRYMDFSGDIGGGTNQSIVPYGSKNSLLRTP